MTEADLKPKDPEAADAGVELLADAPEPRRPIWAGTLAQIAMWIGGAVALAAAGVALVLADAVGWHGFILLAGITLVALLLLYALAAGDHAARALSGSAAPPTNASAVALGAIQALNDPVLVIDDKGRARWANQAYARLAEEAAGLGAALSLPTPDRIWGAPGGAAVYRLTRAAASGAGAREMLPPLRYVDGRLVVFAAEVSPMAGGGSVWRFAEARGADAHDDAQAPDWAQNAPAGLFIADTEGRVLAANSTLRDWVGADAEAALKLSDLFSGEAARAIAHTRGARGVCRLDASLQRADEAEAPVVLALEWDEERPVRVRGVVYDPATTGAPAARRRGEDEPDMGAMFDTAPFGVAVLDGVDPQSALIVDANASLVHLTAGAATEGARFADLFEPGEDGAELFADASAAGEPVEVKLIGGEGARDAHLFLSPVEDGRRAAYLIDVSGLKELERQFAQASKMQAVGQLASTVAHDFNNHLQAIRLNVDSLLGEHPVGDPSYSRLQTVNNVVARAAGLVGQLKAFSRKETMRVERLDLGDIMSDFSILLRQILEESVALDIRHGRDLPPIRTDRNLLENAVMNLATNARDAMKGVEGGGRLVITTEALDAEAVRAAGAPDPKPGRWAAIHVADNGCGMDEETLAKIFEPFFTTKPTGQGTGLGLASVYGIVKQSGGYVFARSTPGEGTTFSIYLPGCAPKGEAAEMSEEALDAAASAAVEADIAARVKPSGSEAAATDGAAPEAKEGAQTAEPAKPREGRAPSDLAGRGRILLVEDEDAVRTITAKSLAGRGYEVVEADDGEMALEILEEQPRSFDLVISDVVMPGLDGPGLLEKAREHMGDARVLFISGYAEEDFSDILAKETDVSFLPKPFTLPQLAERVKTELAKAMSG